MTEIENFLHKNICSYLIDFFNNNLDKTLVYDKRLKLLLNEINDDTIKNVVNLYKSIRPQENLSNIELVKWPVGEYMDWHDDTIHYDFTTITYLNEDYLGGITHVEDYSVSPKTGKIILFEASKKHKVTQLEKGTRFVILAWYKNG